MQHGKILSVSALCNRRSRFRADGGGTQPPAGPKPIPGVRIAQPPVTIEPPRAQLPQDEPQRGDEPDLPVIPPPAPVAKPQPPAPAPIPVSAPAVIIPATSSKDAPQTLTIVTAIIAVDNERNPAASTAIEALKQFTSFRLPVVLYLQAELAALPEVQEALERLAPWARRIIVRGFTDIQALPWYAGVQAVRGLASWQASQPGFAATPQASQPMFNPLQMARLAWLQEAAESNYFETDAFMWVDGT